MGSLSLDQQRWDKSAQANFATVAGFSLDKLYSNCYDYINVVNK
jgi:hypothetical protein